MNSTVSAFLSLAAAAALALCCFAEPCEIEIPYSAWSLPPGAWIEGDRLIAEIPAEEGPRKQTLL